MSLKTFINKYRNGQNNSCSQSSTSSGVSTNNSFASMSQQQSQFSQNSQNGVPNRTSNGQPSNYNTQNYISTSSRKNNMMPIQEEINNNHPFVNPQHNRFLNSQVNCQQNYPQINYPQHNLNSSRALHESSLLNKSFLEVRDQNSILQINESMRNINPSDSFFINSQILNDSMNNSKKFLNQSRIMNVPLNINHQQNINYPSQQTELTQKWQETSQISHPMLTSQLTTSNIPLHSIQDEINKAKLEQKEREMNMKEDLLKEIRGVKEFFKDQIMNEFENLTNKVEERQTKYQKRLCELQDKIEESAQIVNQFLKEKKPNENNKNDVMSSDYVREISELHQLVSNVIDVVEEESLNTKKNIQDCLNKSTKIIYSKINQTKNSVKKQIRESSSMVLRRNFKHIQS